MLEELDTVCKKFDQIILILLTFYQNNWMCDLFAKKLDEKFVKISFLVFFGFFHFFSFFLVFFGFFFWFFVFRFFRFFCFFRFFLECNATLCGTTSSELVALGDCLSDYCNCGVGNVGFVSSCGPPLVFDLVHQYCNFRNSVSTCT